MFKYLGQHIFDFVSKFRNDVYFQNLEELDQNFSIVVGPDGKLSKSKSPAEKSIIEVRNDEGSVIPAGAPLYSKGEIGGSDRIKVGICDASDPAKMPCIGIAQVEMNTSDTKDNFAITQGVYNTNISGFTGLSEGDTLYVNGGSAPYLVSTKPSNGNYIQNVGIVLKTNGTICQGLLVSAIGRTNDVPWPLYVDVSNSRVGIGTTSPTKTLHVISKSSGDGITISTSQDISVATLYNTNSESFPVGAFSLQYGSNNAGLISGQSNRLNIRGGGSSGGSISFASHTTEMMRLTSTGLGIGTTSPTEKLHVRGGNIRIDSNDSRGQYLQFRNNGIPNALLSNTFNISGGSSFTDFNTYVYGNNPYSIWTNNVNRLTVSGTGNVGIGTTSPSEKLEVSGNIKTTGNVTFDGGAGTLDGLRTINRTGEIRINTTQGTRFGETTLSVGGIVDIVGKYDKIPLGIKQEAGTTQNKLATFKDSSGNEVLAITTNGGFETLDSNLVKRFEFGHAYFPSPVDGMGIGLDLKTENASGVVVSVGNIDVIQDDVSADLSSMRLNVGETTPTEIMRLESGGNVGIGTTAPSEKLEVSGNIKASGTIKGKMEQMFACSFSDDLGTTKHYLSFTSNAEQTNVHADQAAMVMPYNGRVKSIQLRLSNIDADTIRTFGIETIAPGINMYASSNNWTIEETEAYELAATDDFYLVNYVFSNTSHFESGDLLAISIQDAEDAYTASRQTYVNVIIEYDLNNGMGNDTATTKYTS